ncbi:hypothetical protein DFP73DRAFT_629072 [Morchella snyderi]|nr:hypothetical protein DFP73DRAFT_629072 [Morchella snyderi]
MSASSAPIVAPPVIDLPGALSDKVKERLQNYITDINEKPTLKAMVEPLLADAAKQAETMVATLIAAPYNCSMEMAIELAILTLYDMVVLIDDSSSMKLQENAKRIATLERTLQQIADIYTLANPTGIKSVRFLNHRQGKGNVKKEDVPAVIGRCAWIGLTMMGSELRRKVLQPFVLKDITALKKPLLVMIITDGQVEGEKKGLLEKVILECMQELKNNEKPSAVAFHFSRVGNDEGAKELLGKLDNHEQVGDHIDCLPMDMPLESIDETNEDWCKESRWEMLPKLLLGAILPSMDQFDEDIKIDDGVGKDITAAALETDVPEDD